MHTRFVFSIRDSLCDGGVTVVCKMALNGLTEIIARMSMRRYWACRRVEKCRLAGDSNEMKCEFTMEHKESLMGKRQPAQLCQYKKQASRWTEKILLNRQVLPNYCRVENLIKFV